MQNQFQQPLGFEDPQHHRRPYKNNDFTGAILPKSEEDFDYVNKNARSHQGHG